ncbi:MAG: hypothetical protein L0J45_07695 [Psychroflexus sp.]|nr:hypothetical protein [Psychroflexus sp.]
MKTLLLSFSLFLLLGLPKFDARKAYVHIGESSQIIIAGKSNVNKFYCDYESSITDREKAIHFTRVDHTLHLKNAKLRLKSKTFDCGKSGMNNDFEELLEAEEHPYIYIDFTTIEIHPDHYFVSAIISIAEFSKKKSFIIKKKF